MSSILFNGISAGVQAILGAAFHGLGSASKTSTNTSSEVSSSSRPDNTELSPFAQLMSTLQQLQLSDPAKYKQITQQIAVNLENAAQTATSQGNPAAATQLNQLSTDFSNASQSGQVPDVLELARAIGGGGHHHHHHAAPAASSSESGSGTGSSSDMSQLLSRLQAAFQPNAAQSGSLNPMSIIFGTLASGGVTGATSS
jgi:hypothetical protein